MNCPSLLDCPEVYFAGCRRSYSGFLSVSACTGLASHSLPFNLPVLQCLLDLLQAARQFLKFSLTILGLLIRVFITFIFNVIISIFDFISDTLLYFIYHICFLFFCSTFLFSLWLNKHLLIILFSHFLLLFL